MANVVRRSLPPVLIAIAVAASAVVYRQVPTMIDLPVEELIPFGSNAGELVARGPALFLMPALALLMWAGLRAAPTSVGQRVGRRLFRHAPDEVTQPGQFERFGNTYETIVLGVVMLFLGCQAAVLAAALQHHAVAVRIIPAVLGASMILMGNVIPRLRPNWVAGLRTRRLLENPQLWRMAHRAFGTAFVLAGVITMVVAVAAPKYGLFTGIGTLVLCLIVGFIASTRPTQEPQHLLIAVGLLAAGGALLGGA